MIADRIFRHYEGDPRRKASSGYPTGSRLGNCTAQLQQARFPSLTKPDIPQPRAVMVWDEGNRTEEWLGSLLNKVFPGAVSLRQTPVYFPVSLPEPWMVDDIEAQIRARSPVERRIWGTVAERAFKPPRVETGANGKPILRGLLLCRPGCREGKHEWGCPAMQGFILDRHQPEPCVWVPSFIDFAASLPDVGPAIIECKSMSNFAFRRAVTGQLDIGKRAQLAGYVAATGIAVVLVGYRKETSHTLDLVFAKAVDRLRITITLMNGQHQSFVQEKDILVDATTGEATEFPGDAMWDHAEVWTPFDPQLLEQRKEHVRKVLLAKPMAIHEWAREAGPDFACAKCHGVGKRVCGHCKGIGQVASKAKKTMGQMRPCGYCAGGHTDCSYCEGQGMLEETDLQFPCSYCASVRFCWPFATATIDTKPHYRVTREDYIKSGLTFTRPEAPVVLPLELPGEPSIAETLS